MDTWLLILGMLAITFATRYSLFAFPDLRFPPLVRQGLHYVPTAVLTAIVVPEAIAPGGQLDLSPANPYLVGTLVAGLVAWKSGRTLVAVLVSFAVFGAMRWSF